jgi:aspyridone synthetase trans-acting enoyl reductase
MHKPEYLSCEKAASLSVGLATVAQVLYAIMKLPLPSLDIPANSSPTLLVYGGSSATGTIVIQAAEL